jgi:hypothetical protein
MQSKGFKLVGDVIEVPSHVKLQDMVDPDGNQLQLAQRVDVQVMDRARLRRAARSPGADPDERRAPAPFARRETPLEAGPRKQGAGPGPEHLPHKLD